MDDNILALKLIENINFIIPEYGTKNGNKYFAGLNDSVVSTIKPYNPSKFQVQVLSHNNSILTDIDIVDSIKNKNDICNISYIYLIVDNADDLISKRKRTDLEKQLAEKVEDINNKQLDHSKDLLKKNLDNQKDTENKKYNLTKETLDKEAEEREKHNQDEVNSIETKYEELLRNDKIYAEVRKQLTTKSFEELKAMIIGYETVYGDVASSLGDTIQNEWIDKLQTAMSLVDQYKNKLGGVNNVPVSGIGKNLSDEADKKSIGELQQQYTDYVDSHSQEDIVNSQQPGGYLSDIADQAQEYWDEHPDWEWQDFKGYDNGGINDYTGLAMLHGTKTKPEFIFNFDQMKTFVNSALNGSLLNLPQISTPSFAGIPKQQQINYNYNFSSFIDKFTGTTDMSNDARQLFNEFKKFTVQEQRNRGHM
jgi:hypothetical protein